MSLILDALKKIEQDKRRAAGGGASELVAVSGSRWGGRHHLLSMGAIAIGSALLAAAAVAFLTDRGPDGTSGSEETSAVMSPPRQPEPAVSEAPPAAPPAPVVATPEPPVDVSPEARLPEAALPEAPAPEAANAALDDDARELDVTRASSKVLETAEPVSNEPVESPETSTPPDEGEDVMHPIRLVGQERILLEALNLAPMSESMEEASDDGPPEELADLVLQGTSVIGGNAVAVISDQRVFEGDRVEGALVVRIGEREVELEVDGKRFKLRL